MENITVEFFVNNEKNNLSTTPNRTLLDVLRDDLGLLGVKNGCKEGECGACTVIFDDKPMNSCLIMIGQVDGHRVRTVEGLPENGNLHPVQKAFHELGAVQCGFCTPGFILSTVALLERNNHPTDGEIKTALAGNLCRCTGYVKIIEAVNAAAEEIQHE
ncbi:MAG: (2Fe-2S)-binding protein [Anaerolineaceae bacterium]|nr:(2Fe-2S)-binding protein [Anaerolineaceae bacterium]